MVCFFIATDKNGVCSTYISWRNGGRLKSSELIRKLEERGWQLVRIKGSHHTFKHPTSPDLITVPHPTKDIAQRYQISPDNIVGHSDIAPQRKYDPGPLFPWQRLAQQGLGAWPDSDRVAYYLAGRLPNSAVPVAPLQQALVRYGYSVPTTGVLDSETQRVISAFQMHFRPANFSGQPDAETEAIALALVDKYRSPVSRTQAIDPDELEEVNRQ